MSEPSKGNPWYVEMFLGIGGWVAGLLAAAAIFSFSYLILKGNDVGMSATSLIIGGTFVAFGCAIGQRGDASFARHFAIAMIVTGLTSASGGFWYLVFELLDFSKRDALYAVGIAGLTTTAALSIVGYFVHRRIEDTIFVFLLMLAVYGLLTISLSLFGVGGLGTKIALVAAAVFVFAGVAIYAQNSEDRFLPVIASAMMIGPLIYLPVISENWLIKTEFAKFQFLDFSVRAILFSALAYCLWLLRTTASTPVLTTIAIVGAGMAFLLPYYGVVALAIVSIGMSMGHRGLTTVGILALAWSIGRFYYDLNLTLLTKSAIMAGLGVTTLVTAFLLSPSKRSQFSLKQPNDAAQSSRYGMPVLLMMFAVFAASLYLVNSSVYRLEAAFQDAKTIHLPLGPRDPRSLIQGDYMALRFDRAIFPKSSAISKLPSDGEVFLKTNEEGGVQFSRIPKNGDKPDANEFRVDYFKTSRRQLRYCPTTFFFQEGDAKLYESARFAVVLVTADGLTRLIDLADADKKTIVPTKN